MDRPLRRCIAALFLVGLSFGASAVILPVAPAAAQEFPDPDDFIDPVTGEFDLEAYLAALAGSQDNDGDPLPTTGSDVDSAVAMGLGLIAVGGAATLASRRRRVPAKHSAV